MKAQPGSQISQASRPADLRHPQTHAGLRAELYSLGSLCLSWKAAESDLDFFSTGSQSSPCGPRRGALGPSNEVDELVDVAQPDD